MTLPDTPPIILRLPWRVGRRVPQHIYVQTSPNPDDNDVPLVTMPTAEIAHHICDIHNEYLRRTYPGLY